MTDTNHQTSQDVDTTTNQTETITEQTDQTINDSTAHTEIDYKTKFSESSKEALRIRDENIRLQNEIELLKNTPKDDKGAIYSNDSEQIIPGFDMMSKEEQDNLIAYTNSIRNTVTQEIYKNPAIAHSVQQYNENVWNGSFEEIASQYPELKTHKDEFKSKYFRADNVPTNIKEILGDIAKVYLFDKARDIGAKQAIEQADRIDTERAGGGEKAPAPERTIEDWQRLQKENPVKFATEYRKSQQGK